MALVIKIWQRIELIDAQGRVHAMGKSLFDQPHTLTSAANDIHAQDHTVAADGIVELFDIADDISAFSAAFVLADQDGLIQFVNNAGSTFFTHETKADLIQPLFGDAAQYGGTLATFDGTADNIERIIWQNTSDDSATVQILAVK